MGIKVLQNIEPVQENFHFFWSEKTGDRRLKLEDRSRKLEDRSWKTEVGSQKSLCPPAGGRSLVIKNDQSLMTNDRERSDRMTNDK